MTTAQQEQLFREWTDAHRGILFKAAHAFAFESDRDDLMQEMLLSLWRAIPVYREGCKPSTFVYRVAHNAALNWQRGRRNYRNRLDRFEAESRAEHPSGVAPSFEHADDRLRSLYLAIQQLPETDRSLVLLYLDDLSYSEMAEVLGITESNIGVRLNRIKKKLTQMIEKEPYEHG